MPRSKVQFQKGLGEASFEAPYGTEAQCRAVVIASRWPHDFECPGCGGQAYCELRQCPRKIASRWWPGRNGVVPLRMERVAGEVDRVHLSVGDLLAALARRGLIGVTRRRLDAALCEPARPDTPGDQGARPGARRDTACRRWRRDRAMPPPSGGRPPSPASMERQSAAWRSARGPWRGSTAGNPCCRFTWCVIRTANAIRRHCRAPARPVRRMTSSAGSSIAGWSRRSSANCATTWAWEPDAGSPIKQSRAPRPVGSGCSPSPHPLGGLGHRLVPQTASNLRRYPRRRAPAGLDRSGFCEERAGSR